MSFGELRAHIGTLEKLGLDVTRLRVELHRKIAYPMVSLIMSMIGDPVRVRGRAPRRPLRRRRQRA